MNIYIYIYGEICTRISTVHIYMYILVYMYVNKNHYTTKIYE